MSTFTLNNNRELIQELQVEFPNIKSTFAMCIKNKSPYRYMLACLSTTFLTYLFRSCFSIIVPISWELLSPLHGNYCPHFRNYCPHFLGIIVPISGMFVPICGLNVVIIVTTSKFKPNMGTIITKIKPNMCTIITKFKLNMGMIIT